MLTVYIFKAFSKFPSFIHSLDGSDLPCKVLTWPSGANLWFSVLLKNTSVFGRKDLGSKPAEHNPLHRLSHRVKRAGANKCRRDFFKKIFICVIFDYWYFPTGLVCVSFCLAVIWAQQTRSPLTKLIKQWSVQSWILIIVWKKNFKEPQWDSGGQS